MATAHKKWESLPPLQKRLVIFLAENGPQTKNELANKLGSGWKDVHVAFKSMEKKSLIEIVDEKRYRTQKFDVYWLSYSGVIAALLNDASKDDVLRNVRSVYPKFEEISLLVELSKVLGKEALELAFYLVKSPKSGIADGAPLAMAMGIFLPTFQAFREPNKKMGVMWPKIDEMLKGYPKKYRQGFRQGIDKSIAKLEETRKALDKEYERKE